MRHRFICSEIEAAVIALDSLACKPFFFSKYKKAFQRGAVSAALLAGLFALNVSWKK